MSEKPTIYGLMAEFDQPGPLITATQQATEAGYRKLDAYTPYPIDEVADALEFRRTRVPLIVLLGGLAGGIGAYVMQYYAAVISYALNVGGRPYHSWPSFIPVTFELTVLIAALSSVVGMLALNRLPMPYHPVFNAPEFDRATQDRFFLCIEAADPRFDLDQTRQLLAQQNPLAISEVPF